MNSKWDILVINHDKDMAEFLRDILESRGYMIRIAYNGREGGREIERKKPDLVILDALISNSIKNFDLAYKFKINKKHSGSPIGMMLLFRKIAENGSEKSWHVLGEQRPVTEVLEKPVAPDELITAMQDILGCSP